MCVKCVERELRGEPRPCANNKCPFDGCPYLHLEYKDPVEIEIADVRNALRARSSAK